MNNPKLILLYGFAASGKTTLAKKYISEHPLAFSIENDVLISHIGNWQNNEAAARKLVTQYTIVLSKQHLDHGYDVIVPCLLSDNSYPTELQLVANETNAVFVEVYIDLSKEDAVNRLLVRGGWGEEGSRRLTEEDRPMLEGRFDYMIDFMKNRSNVQKIVSTVGDVEGAYKQLLLILNKNSNAPLTQGSYEHAHRKKTSRRAA